MAEQTTKVLKLMTLSPPSSQLMPFWPDNIETWFCYAEADFSEHSVNDTRAQFLAVVKTLPREFNRYVAPSMFTSDVSEPYETLKRSILKRGDLTDRQRLDQLLINVDLQHGSATDMLQRMREVIGKEPSMMAYLNDFSYPNFLNR
ncbi:unnamed protein product [Schistosoma margrebowiei]|uniref:DUF7041 domain-containing protein n=1 Tax=Schistosoma margrebowiei TaxID=48269 RepID=A0A183LH41_9TREM|nr:unnamed protein product [Schistosoma margrebowiei]